MGQGTETCDRPTEVSVIRFVSRNRTIEEIAPKQELYTCKQRGCGKVFTNHEEYRTHEALEALKIKFICREPGCGEELSDPGSMWRHYQEWHNNETYVFACPYTSCGTLHATSETLEEHIDSCHRQPLSLPTEPEIICLEGGDNLTDDTPTNSENDRDENEYMKTRNSNCQENTDLSTKMETSSIHVQNITENDHHSMESNDHLIQRESVRQSDSSFIEEIQIEFYEKRNEMNHSPKNYIQFDSARRNESKFPRNEDLLITEENFLSNYESRSSKNSNSVEMSKSVEKNIVFVNNEVTITKNMTNDDISMDKLSHSQEHRIDLGNLEKVFRNGLECGSRLTEENGLETNSNCSEDEEYMPKKQRMSRHKQESYKCNATGRGKMYKCVSHYRHNQDNHKLVVSAVSVTKPAKPPKTKSSKASTVSFFLCKMPGCGAEVNNVTNLWKHYQENHANAKPPVVPASTSIEIFRCKVPGCESEFNTNLSLYKHFNEVHNGTLNNGNAKTGNGSNIQMANEMFRNEVTTQESNVKTDFKANRKINLNDDKRTSKQTIKTEESQDSF